MDNTTKNEVKEEKLVLFSDSQLVFVFHMYETSLFFDGTMPEFSHKVCQQQLHNRITTRGRIEHGQSIT